MQMQLSNNNNTSIIMMNKKINIWSEHTTADIATKIRECTESIEKSNESCGVELWFSETVFDRLVVSALRDLFRCIAESRTRAASDHNNHNQHRKQQQHIVTRLQLHRCEGNHYLDESISAALAFDAIEALCFDGHIGSHDLFSISLLRRNCSSVTNLKELDLRNFVISDRELEILRTGILDPDLRKIGGGLERLLFCGVTFDDDKTVQGLAEALSWLSQKEQTPPNEHENEHETGRFLRTLSFDSCSLKDRHLETIMRSLMEADTAPSITEITPSSTAPGILESGFAAAAPVAIESTLTSLTVQQQQCGSRIYSLLGAWLLDIDHDHELPLYQAAACLKVSCSLETASITIWSAIDDPDFVDPVSAMIQGLSWSNNNINDDDDDTNDEKDIKNSSINNKKYTNNTLKSLRLSGVENMGGLGRLVSEHLLALERLELQSRGTSDPGMTEAGLSSFVAASCASSNKIKRKRCKNINNNLYLRTLKFHCSEKAIQLELDASLHLIKLLDRYSMLQDVRFGLKRKVSLKDKAQHMMNTNAGGRFFFVPSRNEHAHEHNGLPLSLWPTVLEGFHKKLLSEAESYNETIHDWAEYGSIDDTVSSESDLEDEDESDDESDSESEDEDENEPVNVEITNAKGVLSALESPRNNNANEAIEQTANAIFSLFKPNIERLVVLRQQLRTITLETFEEEIRAQLRHGGMPSLESDLLNPLVEASFFVNDASKLNKRAAETHWGGGSPPRQAQKIRWQ